MARQTAPVCKLCRRQGEKLFLKGERCFTPKCPIESRNYPPGMHGKKSQFRRKASDYALQLKEKQKARWTYGVLERQFRRYFKEAEKRTGVTGLALLRMLETRLDNVVYRLGFASSRSQARQLVNHGHILVNGQRADIPSYSVKPGDEISVREPSQGNTYFQAVAKTLGEQPIPSWLQMEDKSFKAKVTSLPSREELGVPLQEQLIVEYYSR
ncbi:MAG: 30S ribosomal protein S4 [Chloroflexi bacterium]|nr:30S ribosomal protein S4 [Chloroflexota bacterium]